MSKIFIPLKLIKKINNIVVDVFIQSQMKEEIFEVLDKTHKVFLK